MLLDKKKLEWIVASILKAIMGLLIMEIGVEVLSKSMIALNYLIPKAFKFIGIMPQSEGAAGLAEFRYSSAINTVVFIGMATNLLLARFTRFKYIFLTGQQIIYMASIIVIAILPQKIPYNVGILTGGVILGSLMTFMPHLIHKYTKLISKNDNVAIGHFSSISFFISSQIGRLFSKKEEESKKNKRKPASPLLFDSTLITSLFMASIFIVGALISGKSHVEDISGGSNFIIFAFRQALTFGAGVYIILTGVRMFIQEIIPAFKSFATKFVPDAVVALDISVLFPYHENIMMLGFIFSFFGGICASILMSFNYIEVILPSILIHFFVGGGSGIYGYATGGKRGCMAGSFVTGILLNLGALMMLSYYKKIGFNKFVFGEMDLSVVGYIISKIIEIIK